MRIVYLSHSYVPSRRADSVQVMKMCAAWSQDGHEVLLATKHCPPRQESGVSDDHGFYGVAADFAIMKLARPAWRGGGWIFEQAIGRLLRRESRDAELFYCRDAGAADRAAAFGLPFALEAHVPPSSGRLTRMYRRFLSAPSCRGLVVISEALHAFLRSQELVPPALAVVVAPDGADPRTSRHLGDLRLADCPRPRIGYVGQLYEGKGVEMILHLADRLPEASFHLVGGDDERVRALRSSGTPVNVTVHGFVPPSGLDAYYDSLDIVLMPYSREVMGASATTDLARWMSPMKMFEYMAAGKPIVSADLPVLREILRHDENALLVEPDVVDAWEAAIRRLVQDNLLADRIGRQAASDLELRFSWQRRGRRILEGLGLGFDAS